MAATEKKQQLKFMHNASLIAPCGIYCGACRAFLRKKNRCPGCRADESEKPKTRVYCGIKNCSHLSAGNGFCGGCGESFPCRDAERLSDRYKRKYNTDVIENLNYILRHGQESFLKQEIKKRKCHECGGMVCMHTSKCSACGKSTVAA